MPVRFDSLTPPANRRRPAAEPGGPQGRLRRYALMLAGLLLAWSYLPGAALAQASGAVTGVGAAPGAGDGAVPTVPAPASKRAPTDTVVVVAPVKPPDGGPGLSATGAGDYSVTAADIANLPTGGTTPITDILAQMPGVAIDQNQQIHIRNTEGPQFQYQINGALVPLDINTNPPFLSMIDPSIIRRLDLIDGVLPSRYSYATGGVVDIQTKNGCEQTGGSASLLAGQRDIVQPSAQFGGCAGRFSYYFSGLYLKGETAFSSATPGPTPLHDFTSRGQAFGYFTFDLAPSAKVSLVLSTAASNNQLPDVPGLTPQYVLAGVSSYQSANINSKLNFQDDLAILALDGTAGGGMTYKLAYAAHFISQAFRPDNAGELIFQGVSSTATHYDVDNTLEADLTGQLGAHTLGAGVYAGEYRVTVDDSSLVFPVLVSGQRINGQSVGGAGFAPAPPPFEPGSPQTSTTPERIIDNIRADNLVLGLYVSDLWRIGDRLRADLGVRFDQLTGFTNHQQIDPSLNLSYQVTDAATVHGGVARYMQVPSFQGIAPSAPSAFNGTSGATTSGLATPLTEDDYEVDVGVVVHLGSRIILSQDDYYERTHHYLDTGQLGAVPIFAPFNYDHGYIWGSEFAANFKGEKLSAYTSLTIGQNMQKGVVTGQFNFDNQELAYINAHYIPLDHQPLAGGAAGVAYKAHGYLLSLNAIYSTGLRGGFADQQQLPAIVQVNASVERSFVLPRLGRVTNRITVLNAFDRVNLIRPAEGIGIAQSGYGPRFTLLDALTVAF